MGYWEVPCQFCGVSFNINRVRMKDEPRSAAMSGGHRTAWVLGREFHGDKEQKQFERLQKGPNDNGEEDAEASDDGDNDPGRCCSLSTGCSMVLRPGHPQFWSQDGADWWLYGDDPEDGICAADPSYEYLADSDDEILEYDSDAGNDGETPEIHDTEPAEAPEWIFKVTGPDPPDMDTEFLPLDHPLGAPLLIANKDGSYSSNRAAQTKADRLEHVAGPGCRNREAYIGKNISVEEMRGCHTVQGILWRKPDSTPRADDLPFERRSSYFLTGIAERMPSSGSWLDCYPVRYDADDRVETETNFVLKTSQEELRNIALPFHPTCFELYIQATRRRNDRVDLDTLVHIRDKACVERRYFPVKYSQDVLAATAQCWEHKVGHEYLVANPVFVPGLRAMLEAAISNDDAFSMQNSAFEKRPQREDLWSQDPFLALPAEIIQTIASQLSSVDVARIRLSSRAFTHLPVSFFYRLILDEMPWLYEAWSPETNPYYWATVIARDMLDEKRERPKFMNDLEQRREIIQRDMPGIAAGFVANEPKFEPPRCPEWQEILCLAPISLPRDKTNWYKVFCSIRSNWSSLKGLQNRERIWENVNQILDAIEKARAGLDFYLHDCDLNGRFLG